MYACLCVCVCVCVCVYLQYCKKDKKLNSWPQLLASTHPSIFFSLSQFGIQRQEPEQGSSNFPLQGDPKVLQSQLRDIVPSACPGSSGGLLPVGCALNTSPGRHPGGLKVMPEPQASLNEKEQRLSFELLPLTPPSFCTRKSDCQSLWLWPPPTTHCTPFAHISPQGEFLRLHPHLQVVSLW